MEGQDFPQLLSPLHSPPEGQQVLTMLIYELIRVETGASCNGWVGPLQVWGGSVTTFWLAALSALYTHSCSF